MSNNRFEQLIEYVINDETAKAKELFHQIVVEKSRAIYEDLMDKEEVEEDNAMGMEPTEIDADMSEDIGGSQAQAMMGGDDGMGGEMGGMDDTPDMSGIEVQDDEFETESQMMPMEEAISLKAAPKPVTSEEGGVNKKSTVAANSGAAGMASKPVHTTGDTAHGRPAPSTKELIGRVGNTPAQSTQDLKPATKPHTGQAAGVNTKSPLPSGRKG